MATTTLTKEIQKEKLIEKIHDEYSEVYRYDLNTEKEFTIVDIYIYDDNTAHIFGFWPEDGEKSDFYISFDEDLNIIEID